MTLDLVGPRITAEGTLEDRMTFMRATSDATLDRVTGQLVQPFDTEVWSGPVSITLGTLGSAPEAADSRLVASCVVRVPVACDSLQPGDTGVATFIHEGGDQTLLAKALVVDSVDSRTHIVLRRIGATLVVHDAGSRLP